MGLAVVQWRESHTLLEKAGEVETGIEAGLFGDALYAECRIRQKALGFVDAELEQVLVGGKSGVLFEESSEGGVAHSVFCGMRTEVEFLSERIV